MFVDRALPGEQLTARVLQSKKSFARAAKLATLAPHEHAVQPPCQVGWLGGKQPRQTANFRLSVVVAVPAMCS